VLAARDEFKLSKKELSKTRCVYNPLFSHENFNPHLHVLTTDGCFYNDAAIHNSPFSIYPLSKSEFLSLSFLSFIALQVIGVIRVICEICGFKLF
jgi:hypothetical protein